MTAAELDAGTPAETPAWARLLPHPEPLRPRVWATVSALWGRMRAEPRRAGPILSEGLRGARTLGSKERPLAGDTLLGLLRHERALARLDPDPLTAWELLDRPDLPARLRAADRAAPLDPRDPALAFAVALSVPEDLGRSWWSRLGPDAAWALGETLNRRAPVVLRLLREPRALPPHRRLGPATVALEGRVNLDLLEDYREGRVIVQDAGSQRVAERAFPGAGARVLDLCAGAGGKSLTLAALGARVQAWDVRRGALDELGRRAARAGLSVAIGPPRGTYDRVLVDAPCSGSGVLRRHPENRWKLEAPLDTQARLLEQALGLAPEVVYATCALREEENEQMVRRFGEPVWEETLWPGPDQDGFYVALLRGGASRGGARARG